MTTHNRGAQRPWRAAALLAVCTTGVSAMAQAPDTAAARIRLADAVGAAQRNSVQAVQAHGQITTAVTEERAAYAAFLPNVSVGLNSNFSNTFGNNGNSVDVNNGSTGVVVGNNGRSNFSSSSAITASLTLFDGGRRIYDVRAARADLTAAEASNVNQAYATALAVNQSFFNALAAREQLAAGESQLALADSAARIANLRTRLRVATVSDSLRAAISVVDARLAIATALTSLASANATLSRLVASPVIVTADPADTGTFDRSLPDSASLRVLAENGPLVKLAAAQQTVSVEQRRAARSAFLPQVDATYSFSGNGQNPYLGLGAQAYGNRVGLSVSLPILDQFQRQSALSRADVAAGNSGASAKDARLAARETLTQAVGTMQLAAQRMTEQALSMRAAEEDLRIQLDRYRIGEATIVEVLTSQSELTQARAALIQARFDFRVARAQIESVTGKPL
ncbi:MAG TPA: TolC family protein [Gemmatimonadaceae bacterium]|nr:TolC family protein [Gemmatimonadaceae bacterium]